VASTLTKSDLAEVIKLARLKHGLSWFDGKFLDYAWKHAEQEARG
jgi:hypothetical protein